MKIVIAGGTGLIGSKVAARLLQGGIQPVIASRATGVNTFTGEGLERALEGADVVIDVTNSSYTDYAGAQEFFATSTLNLLSYGAAAGVSHHVALSVVGTDRLAASEGGYFTAKLEQERLIRASGHPFSIVHATQFFEFLLSIAEAATRDGVVRVAHAQVQPMAADDVAEAVLRVATADPTRAITEFAGPERFRLDSVVRTRLWVQNDARQVIADPLATYFGTDLAEDELLPGPEAVLMPTRFDDWIRHAA
ncbi:NAD(P)H-binding protein [Protaetiibacter sp. SSC-01]|uniref:SDR family oxidoreductase n=1 Tax=Protaetiibacter sp. SSC-01 TaxID=2759943 RepID=UPI0016571085|nr:NAD(P)H-binding protein [Protaetiibacter sp. SSC-01]QNO38114.1 NAD(P)H-binding protein [Protaetiibacter sp. SSC-01]